MTTFVTPITHGTSLQRIVPSLAVPALRFAGDPVMWIRMPPSTSVVAFATGAVARKDDTTNPFPALTGSTAGAWTLFQLSPLPQMNRTAFQAIAGGLPVQLVVVVGTVPATPASNDCLVAGQTLAPAPGGTGAVFLGFAFQDRLCRDPLTWAEAIAASGACDGNWSQFATDLAALPGARNLRILDGRGAPRTTGTVSVSVDGGPATSVALTAGNDGDTGIAIGAAARATVTATSMAHPIVAAGDAAASAFEAGLALAPGARMAQVLDADLWLAAPNPGVRVARWQKDSAIETIQEGTPYFARLVTDLRAAKPSGKVELAGWAFVKGSAPDATVDWPLIPGDASTTILGLIQELRGAGVEVRMLVNQFLRFDAPALDDFPELAPILVALWGSLGPLQALVGMSTDPAGYVVGLIAVAAINIALSSSWTLDRIKGFAEYSQPLVDALTAIDPTIATWTPYPAAFADNPLVPPPPKVLGHTIDDISHLGVYHQKYVIVQPAAGAPVAYLGGIDINSDRVDTTLHRAVHPFHDVQVRITGPAVADVIRSYEERAILHGAAHPIATPADGALAATGQHLVQIARTYFAPAPGSPTPALTFAPAGETTPVRTLEAAIAQARDYIYIEDQYFTPPDDYVNALIAAAGNGVRALILTVPFQTDQPYGGVRRADVLAALTTAWGSRFHVGTPLRRFLHQTPALTTNLGRMRLASALTPGASQCDLSPLSHIPAPPFWAFIGGELVLVHASVGGPSGTGATAKQSMEIVRASGLPGWGAVPVAHVAGEPVTAIQIPGIYVHAKVTIIDDVFVQVGSSNVNRRGFYHDGEINSFTVPQHLKGAPDNPARVLRCRLMAEHMGLSPEMGQSLFADPISAIEYFARSWYQGSHRTGLDFFGSVPPDVSIGTGDSVGSILLHALIGGLQAAAKTDVWTLLADPTTALDPSPGSKGPGFP